MMTNLTSVSFQQVKISQYWWYLCFLAPLLALNRKKIIKVFDACELDKKDTVVVSKSLYRVLTLLRRNRAKFLYVPNDMLGGDSD